MRTISRSPTAKFDLYTEIMTKIIAIVYLQNQEVRTMSNIYEAFVDIKEYDDAPTGMPPHVFTKRYEVDAASQVEADRTALYRAESEYPKATEFDVRMTRLLQ